MSVPGLVTKPLTVAKGVASNVGVVVGEVMMRICPDANSVYQRRPSGENARPRA